MSFRKATALAFGLLPLIGAVTLKAADKGIDFNRDIRPILSDKCFACHGPDEEHQKADLRLDLRSGALADLGDGVQAIVPGNLEKSEMVYRIDVDDPDEIMPPPKVNKPLTVAERGLLKRWIKEGATYDQAWTYVAPKRHSVPKAKTVAWSYNWIDNFLLDRFKREGLKPSPDADPTTLIRRVHLDLTGLPPTPEDVKAFLADKSPGAYEKVVDRLLASSHFGERMAVYWLDLVRFADTVGYHGDQDHRVAPYRDYVIKAFNSNMPFDQFTREQLAGDLLPNPTLDQQVATCYNRLLQTSHEGGVQAKEYLAIYAADRVRNVSNVWMGATVGCAQCHNHKYDPYSTKDFYSLAAFFADMDDAAHLKNGTNSLPTKREPEISVPSPDNQKRLAVLAAEISSLKGQLKSADKGAKKGIEKQLKGKEAARKKILDSSPKVMVTKHKEPRVMRVLPRGNWLDDSGEIVEPAIPTFLGKLPTDKRATRLDLANWLVDKDDPSGLLTARVQVNRFWYLLFGTGIAKVLDDFGGQGVPPVHPELLDNLAVEFVESGWDVKHMMKLIAMSRAYRQSSVANPDLLELDPYNQLAARQSRYRLPAEFVRDQALAVSGLLVDKLGGPSVKPYQPVGYYRHLNFPTRKYKQHPDDRQWRRGVYVHWQRQFLHPMLKAFDAPTREECTAERPRSNTPLAALVLLNDPTFVEAARGLATRVMRETGSQSFDARLKRATWLTWSRASSPTETKVLKALYDADLKRYKADAKAANAFVAVGLKPAPKDLPIPELAAWTSVARALLSSSEATNRD